MSNPWAGKVRCTHIQPVAPQLGALLALADVAVGKPEAPALVIRGVKVLKGSAGAPLVARPDRRVGLAWQPVIELEDEDLKEEVCKVVLDAWRQSIPTEQILLGG